MRLLLVSVFALLSVLVMPAQQAHACSCMEPNTQEMMRSSENGFVGTLAERDERLFDSETVDFHFEVEQWLGEDLGPTVTVASSAHGASCGFEIPVGHRAAVFISKSIDGWTGGLCSTMSAEVVLADLGLESPDPDPNGSVDDDPPVPADPENPLPPSASPETDASSGFGRSAIAIVIVGVVGAGLFLVARRRMIDVN